MPTDAKAGAVNLEDRCGLVSDGGQHPAGGAESDGHVVGCVGGDLEVVSALHRRSVRQVEQNQGCCQGGVLDDYRQRDSGLRPDMSALVSNGGQLMESISQSSGIQGEGEIKLAGTCRDVKVIASLEVGKIIGEGCLACRVYCQAGGTGQAHAERRGTGPEPRERRLNIAVPKGLARSSAVTPSSPAKSGEALIKLTNCRVRSRTVALADWFVVLRITCAPLVLVIRALDPRANLKAATHRNGLDPGSNGIQERVPAGR